MSGRPVLCIGECLIDLIALEGGTLAEVTSLAIREGGAPANVAVGLSRMGIPSAFCGVVGDDPFGERLRTVFAENHVNVEHLHTTDKAETSVAYAWRDDRGDGYFRLLRQADCRLSATFTIGAIKALTPAAIVVGSVSMATAMSKLGVTAAIRAATEMDIPIIVDLNIRISQWKSVDRLRRVLPGLIRQATLIKLSVDDARAAWDIEGPWQIRERIAQWNKGPVVITDGLRGVFLFRDDQPGFEWYPVFPVKAIEPTGAGDAFLAGLITRLVENEWQSISSADIRFAMAAGAITTTKAGALAALPTHDEVERFLAEMA